MNEPLISIIVPVRNSEKYLERCLESIVSQKYHNFEIVIVNDGSTDNSWEICKKYSNKLEFVRIFSLNSRGISAVRNFGIKKAKGSFIMFVDSDDYVTETFCSKAMESQQKYNADVVIFDYQRVIGNKKYLYSLNSTDGIIDKNIAMQYSINNSYTWNKLYRKKLFNEIEYPVGKLYEDEYTTYKIFEKAKVISYINNCSYNYVKNGESIVVNKDAKHIADQFDSVYVLFEFLKDKYPTIYKKNLNVVIIKSLRYCTFCPPEYNYSLFKKAEKILIENKIPGNLEVRYKVTMFLFKLSPKLALLIFKLQKLRKRKEIF